jgi:hypothetical protein
MIIVRSCHGLAVFRRGAVLCMRTLVGTRSWECKRSIGVVFETRERIKCSNIMETRHKRVYSDKTVSISSVLYE